MELKQGKEYYVARDADGVLVIFESKPTKDENDRCAMEGPMGIWSNDDPEAEYEEIDEFLGSEQIKWTDSEPKVLVVEFRIKS